ncbi:hypothetical protein KTH_56100 [Thermosporothrix hazakensis]|jgi:hypothetical protein|nr:hypothetical protein KTH_56100 [Thermosporothrix hazakensis]
MWGVGYGISNNACNNWISGNLTIANAEYAISYPVVGGGETRIIQSIANAHDKSITDAWD